MSPEPSPPRSPAPLTEVVARTPNLQTAHILFMDIVGFSRLRTQQQVAVQVELSRIVQSAPEVIAARSGRDTFLCRPTGDGMALLFFRDKLSPIRCALQIHGTLQADDERIRQQVGAPIRLRMGIHTGDVTLIEDMNAQVDAAGEGMILAQRVMDAGDTDHILLSAEVARTLLKIDPWPRYLTDLGQLRVKHRQIVHLYNLYGRLDGPYCGNPARPARFREDAAARSREARAQRLPLSERLRPHRPAIVTLLLLGTAAGGGAYWVRKSPDGPAHALASVQSALRRPTPKPSGTPKVAQRQEARMAPAPRLTASRPQSPVVAERIAVPDLLHETLESAHSLAESRGLRLQERRGERPFAADYPEGTICQQIPTAGASVPRDTILQVRVSAGPPEADEPDSTLAAEEGNTETATADTGANSSL